MLCKITQCAGHTLANARQHIIICSCMNKIESGGWPYQHHMQVMNITTLHAVVL